MAADELSVGVLKDIRTEVRKTNDRLEQTNARIDQTNERLDIMREELSRRIVDSEIRTSTAITELAGTVRDLTGVLRSQADLRPRVERCERDIEGLKKTRRPGPSRR